MSGVRSAKVVNGERHEYVTQNGRVVRDYVTYAGTDTFVRCNDFIYDEAGRPFAMRCYYDSTLTGADTFHYVLNAQGDVVQIIYQGETVYAEYSYDAWGNITSIKGSSSGNMYYANLNPLRYRGYYYDTETGFYYLQSRYYDPAVKRFLNADSYASTGQGFLGYNMFAYCGNNPVLRSDPSGSYFITDLINELKSILQAAVQSAKNEMDLRNLPYHGEPGSSRTLYNPDGTPKQKRWYGPDGTPERDRDYNHDGDMEFPHDHDWEGGKRGKEHLPPSPDYDFSTDPPIRI